MNELSGLENIAPGISDLSLDELVAMHKFTLLWTLFEAQVLGNSASVDKISQKVHKIDAEIIRSGWFDDQLSYFIKRYTDESGINQRFSNLHLRKNDNPDLVCSVLKKESEEPACQLIACLTIIYRFRNNFFHGIKWAYGCKDQLDNFKHSIILLKNYLEKVPTDN
ncbi:Uncharacterised protein [Klebsiella michiganensis]|uniref:Apea-like HEPN domain-containing protein n=1 Tax=Klebsiella michiganensis TaxID=1134687 RepID=A0A7H4LS47_9ENTR|nr:hypothetical protein [Klebsiella michiganensis]ELT9742705.1 hypothetical protein [Klebsiella michiganensis]MCY0834199.1 hypothetical protein [Klebsiella michiganensis]MDD7826792.1 hypothetical protein [Klebsiella michiganensis]MDD7855715.1 hypothetical protein [Klebsiella michiganensis]STR38973.1 Uncharacterised protein [Klebsiella michiganensis]